MPGIAYGVFAAGRYAYVGDLKWLRVLDVSNPSAPREIASYKRPGYAEEISIVDGTVYIANNDAGLMILGLKAQVGEMSQRSIMREPGPIRRTAVPR